MSRLTNLKPRIAMAPVQRIRSHFVERIRGRAWMAIRARVLSDDPLCPMCRTEGRVGAATEVDHVVPLHMGGGNDRANLVGLCRAHHAAKSADELEKRTK